MSHENPVSEHIFVVNPEGEPGAISGYHRVDAREAKVGEAWFRDAIAAEPELVIAPCRRAHLTHEMWHLWAKEVGVRGVGSIDVLLVSESGRLAIVETKLSYNPESRRAVLAQVLEYATHLRQEDLENVKSGSSRDIADKVSRRLQERDFLVIIAGDELDARAVHLGQTMLTKHSLGSWNLAMVDMMLYRRVGNQEGPEWLMVPCLRGTLTHEVRHIIRLEGVPGGMVPTVVEREALRPEPVPGSRAPQKGEFLAEFADPAYRAEVEHLLQLSRSLGFTLERGSAGISIRLAIQGRKQPLTIGWVFPPGRALASLKDVTLGFQPDRAFPIPGLEEALERYAAALQDLPGAEPIRHTLLRAWRVPPEVLIRHHERVAEILSALPNQIRDRMSGIAS